MNEIKIQNSMDEQMKNTTNLLIKGAVAFPQEKNY